MDFPFNQRADLPLLLSARTHGERAMGLRGAVIAGVKIALKLKRNAPEMNSMICIIFIKIRMQDFLSSSNTSQGVVITRLNYNRPKWFGGFFGSPEKHNKSGNCVYDANAMAKIISP
mgnify:FL=1